VNTHDETAEDSVTTSVNGFDELVLTDGDTAVKVTIGSSDRWDRSHLRRLRQSADLPGLVPVIDSDFASDGKAFAVTPVIDEPTLASMIPPAGPAWQDCAAITEAAARATHEAHLRGLFHGALSPDQIYIVGDDVAVAGIGLGLGGTPRSDYHHWVAPEVLDGLDATERSDVYSLGKILEASLGDSLEDVPRSVRRLIMWSGSDTPEARPPSALEFASILAEALGDERKTYSPAFIPTAEANTLASTASGVVAAHAPADSSAAAAVAGSAAVAGATAVGGAALADQIGDVDEIVDLGDEAEEIVDSGIDVIDNEVAAEVPEELDADALVDDDGYDGVPEDAIITGEVDVDDDVEVVDTADEVDDHVDVTSEAVQTTDLEDIDVEPVSAEAPFDSREYSEGISEAAATTADSFEVPAAQTIELDRSYQDESRGNRAGILVGAILALGFALIAYQLLRTGDADPADDAAVGDTTEDAADEESTPTSADEPDDAEDAVAAPSTAEDTDTEDATENATDDAADEEPATTTTTEPTTTTTAPPSDPAVAQAPTRNGPVPAGEAGLQIVHGIPGTDVDIYVDGEAVLPGFSAGTIAGPVELSAGSHVIDVYSAIDGAPARSGDRTDSPVTSETVTVGDEAASLFAHLDADGQPTLSAYPEDLSATEAAQGRLVVRHLAQAPEVMVMVDGEAVEGGTIANGQSVAVALAAGDLTVSAVTEAGDTVAGATLSLDDGELASITVFGAADNNTLDAIVQRFTGLSSAPAAVPTGDSNLLGADDDLTNLYIVGAMSLAMALAGGAVMAWRRRAL
jgi:hypothetical protein